MDTDSLQIKHLIDLQNTSKKSIKELEISIKQNSEMLAHSISSDTTVVFLLQNHFRTTNTQLDSLVAEIGYTRLEISKQNEGKLFNKITFDTAFAVAITLLIFMLGRLIDTIIKSFKKRRKQKSIRKYFCDNVHDFYKKVLVPLNKAYADFYRNTNIDTGIPLTPPIVLTSESVRIREIDFKDTLEAFKYDEIVKKSQQYVEFTTGIMNSCEQFHNTVLEKSNFLRDVIQNKGNLYLRTLAIFLEEEKKFNPDYRESDLWNLINEKVVLFYTSGSDQRRLISFYKNILRVIQEFIVKGGYRESNPRTKPISELGKELSEKYRELRHITAEIRLQYRAFYFSLTDISEKLDEVVQTFSKKKWF